MKQAPGENQPALLSIGGLSRCFGVPVETLWTWEKHMAGRCPFASTRDITVTPPPLMRVN